MAKTTEKEPKNETTAVAVQNNNAGMITIVDDNGNENRINVEELVSNVNKMQEGASITSTYLTFEESDLGETKKLVYIGMTNIKKIGTTTGETVPAVKFIDASDGGAVKTNADKVLISTCAGLKVGKPIAVTFTGWEKSGAGKYRQFQINELN